MASRGFQVAFGLPSLVTELKNDVTVFNGIPYAVGFLNGSGHCFFHIHMFAALSRFNGYLGMIMVWCGDDYSIDIISIEEIFVMRIPFCPWCRIFRLNLPFRYLQMPP